MKNLLFRLLPAVAFLFFISQIHAQVTFPRNGVYDERDGVYAFTNATIYTGVGEPLQKATLLIRKGRIEQIGNAVTIPKEAIVYDCKDKCIYPSFIDMYAQYGMPEVPKALPSFGRPQFVSNKKGAFSWNEALRSEFNASDVFASSDKDAETFRAAGFGAVLSHRADGISRGSGILVTTSSAADQKNILKTSAAHFMSFSKGSSTQNYPSSLMGAISLLRQSYLDAAWYTTQNPKEETNFSIEAWNNLQNLPQIFEVSDKLEILRAARIAKEFNKKYIIKGNGDEYQRADEIIATGSELILPLNFPDAYDVEDPLEARLISLENLKHWELAPSNAALLYAAGKKDFAFTSFGLKDKKDIFKQIQKVIEAGLPEDVALRALTTTPAKLLGIESELGTLAVGKRANFLVLSDKISKKDVKLYHNWVNGDPYVLNDFSQPIAKGTYSFSYGDSIYKGMTISETNETYIYKTDTNKIKADLKLDRNNVLLTFTPIGSNDIVRLSGILDGGTFKGDGTVGNGTIVKWSAAPMASFAPTKMDSAGKTGSTGGANSTSLTLNQAKDKIIYPFVAYGTNAMPIASKTLIKNATIWTSEAQGILKNTDVLIENGKISQIGSNLSALGATVIDGTGKHLSAGIIDEHSHIGISKGVNEGSQSSTAEVRIADVVNSDDVNIYRQLAGGVTSSHLLHGSANAIGGQTQLIKLRWGKSPEALKFEGWGGFIKFALGENVKQANWGDNNRVRFPQTRMGVEQVFEDHFERAQEYLALKKSGKNFRKDIELEALGEILEGKRFITCHSYVQSEITMLLRVADKYNFKVNTFTHILEGYKVADKMAKHGAAGSTFGDWWAYKFEVYEAIPYNARMMSDAGVNVAINSDDAEMARRLNQEAAKSIMYTDMDEQAALKMVTINPAIMLHVNDKVGSIKVSKDADLVLWTDNPMSIYAKPEQTYVDGIKYFDLKDDVKLRETITSERARLIQKMLAAKKSGAPTQAAKAKPRRLYSCDDTDVEIK